MSNVQLIKKSLLPLLDFKIERQYKNLFNNGWITDFIKTMTTLDSKVNIEREKLEGLGLEKALDKYATIINAWNPQKTLEVFWIKRIKIYKACFIMNNSKNKVKIPYKTLIKF